MSSLAAALVTPWSARHYPARPTAVTLAPTARDESTDDALMAACLAGDVRAFEKLYARLSPRIVRYLRTLTGETAGAEDLAQQTFLKVYRARDTFQPGSAVVPWVFAIARRTFLDDRRYRARRHEVLSADGTLPEGVLESVGGDAFDRLDDRELRALHDTLAELPDAQREALVLTKLQGLSVAEAAAVCGTTPGALKVRAHRAYERIRAALGVVRPAATEGT